MISGEVAAVLPDLQDWAATRTLARSQPANTQPTQPKDGAGAKTALCDSPETPLGFSVMAITSPITVTPQSASRESSTFLLPLGVGQVETLLTTRAVLTTSTSRDLISLQQKLSACPIFSQNGEYGPWNPLQTQQFVKGEENTDSLTLAQGNADSIRAAELVKLRWSATAVNGTQSEAV